MTTEPPTDKLHKVLARAGVGSRRACEDLIRQGRVRIGGRPATVADRVRPDATDIEVDGRPLEAPEPPVHIVLHKPAGYITTARDPQGRPTVLDLVPGVTERIYPVGRLDADTTGLLLLTNDGDLAMALTHPRHEVPRVYRATVTGSPDERALRTLRQGVLLEDGMTAPARVAVRVRARGSTVLEIEIHEGRNRQVRRMCLAVGHPVLKLERVRMGPLTLGSLAEGDWRTLEEVEVEALRRAASGGGAPPDEGPAGRPRRRPRG